MTRKNEPAKLKTLVFGPVPSRRLGRSLGVNNIPPKVCTYSCAYCQLGRTMQMEIERREFYRPEEIFSQVKDKLLKSASLGEEVDYITFVPDGEPTLDINLGLEIQMLKPLGRKIAVITNASLLSHDRVMEDLKQADWVSLKVDSVIESSWRKINRPHRQLDLETIKEGTLEFSKEYKGELNTETMLISGVNDDPKSLQKTAEFLGEVDPSRAYITVPIRPPAESWVRPPPENVLTQAFQIFSSHAREVELLSGYEGLDFGLSGNIEENILGITAVHPMREEALEELLNRGESSWDVVRNLIQSGQLVRTEYQGKTFYLRRIKGLNQP